MVRNIEFKYHGAAYELRPTFELLQKLEQKKPVLQMLTAVRDGASLTDVAQYFALLLREVGVQADMMEVLQSLSAPDTSSVDHIIMEVLRAAMPNLFDDAKKAEPPKTAAKASSGKKAGKTG